MQSSPETPARRILVAKHRRNGRLFYLFLRSLSNPATVTTTGILGKAQM